MSATATLSVISGQVKTEFSSPMPMSSVSMSDRS